MKKSADFCQPGSQIQNAVDMEAGSAHLGQILDLVNGFSISRKKIMPKYMAVSSIFVLFSKKYDRKFSDPLHHFSKISTSCEAFFKIPDATYRKIDAPFIFGALIEQTFAALPRHYRGIIFFLEIDNPLTRSRIWPTLKHSLSRILHFLFSGFFLSQGTYKRMPGIVRTASDTHTV